jgi:hypothetical protein
MAAIWRLFCHALNGHFRLRATNPQFLNISSAYTESDVLIFIGLPKNISLLLYPSKRPRIIKNYEFYYLGIVGRIKMGYFIFYLHRRKKHNFIFIIKIIYKNI